MRFLIVLLLILAPAHSAGRYELAIIPVTPVTPLEAAPHFCKVLQADPTNATALMGLLERQLLLHQRSEARLSAQRLTRLLSPRDPRYLRVASLLAAHHDYVAAIPLMENVQPEFPQSYEVNFNLALAYFDAQSYEKAAETLGSLINHEPPAEAYNLLAMVEEQRQRYLEAVRAFQRPPNWNPTTKIIALTMGTSCCGTRRPVQRSLFCQRRARFPELREDARRTGLRVLCGGTIRGGSSEHSTVHND